MIVRETLPDGSLLLRGGGGGFIFQRPKPGTLIVRIAGADLGQFGSVPLELVESELGGGVPLSLYVDASSATAVRDEVAELWVDFLVRHRDRLRRCTFLASERSLPVASAFGRCAAVMGERLTVLWDREEFERAAGTVVEAVAPPQARETLAHGVVRMRCANTAFTYLPLGPDVLHVIIEGMDRGELGDAPLREIARHFSPGRSLELEVDASGAQGATEPVADAWTRWFRTNRERLGRVTILVAAEHLHQTIELSRLLSGTGELIRIVTDRAHFSPPERARLVQRMRPPRE